MNVALQFLLAFVLVPIIDYLWIGLLMQKFYVTELGALARTVNGEFKAQLWPAVMVYLALALGITALVIPRASSIMESFLYGACLGFVVYAVYDFTNLSILQNYSIKMTLVDVAWGTFLCGIISTVVYFANTKLA